MGLACSAWSLTGSEHNQRCCRTAAHDEHGKAHRDTPARVSRPVGSHDKPHRSTKRALPGIPREPH